MPIKFTLRFRLKLNPKYKDKTEFLITPDVLHGFFFSLLPENLAEELHRKTQYQPFALFAPQIFKAKPIEDTSSLFLTISFLQDRLFSPFLQNLFSLSGPLFLGPYRAYLDQGPGTIIFNDLYLDYEDFLAFPPKPFLYFHFKTPTVLKKQGENYLKPEAPLIFKSLIQKWKAFSPLPISLNLRSALENGLKPVFERTRVQKIIFSFGNKISIFKGKVLFDGKGLSEEELRWLCALSAFSEFAGIGRKTTMGLGMVSFKALESPEEVLGHGESPNSTDRSL